MVLSLRLNTLRSHATNQSNLPRPELYSYFTCTEVQKERQNMNYPARILVACLLVLGLALNIAPTAIAQTVTATLTGTVSDQTGALVPNVKVLATNQGTKIEYTAQSNDSGVYTIP